MFQAKEFSSNFYPTDDLESRGPWRSFTRPRLHPWTSLAFVLGNLRDWLVPDSLSRRRNPLTGLKPDVAGVKVSKERTIASPSFRDPTMPSAQHTHSARTCRGVQETAD